MTTPRARSSRRSCFCLFWLICVCPTAPADQYSQDFRGRRFDPKLFRPIGRNAHQAISANPGGLRIALNADHGDGPPVGLIGRPGVRGDFEITLAFKVIRADKPTAGSGPEVSIWISTTANNKEAAQIAWHLPTSGQPVFSAMRAFTPPEGQREFRGDSTTTEARRGKLRLVRTGSTLKYSAAPEGSNAFKEVYQTEFGTEDLEIVRFAVENGGSPTVVDVCIESVNVGSEELGSARVPPLPPRGPGWPLIGLFAALSVGGYWLWRRSKRKNG